MKIAWFTPFSKNSAIGKYSQSITNELIKECEVDLWLSANDADPLFTELKIFYYSREDLLDKLKGYDFIIYNMGNYLPFHKDIYEASNKIKGVVILHDFVMHHFFSAYYLHKGSKEAYINDIEKLYGVNIRDIALASINGKRTPLWETEEVMEYPFFEKAIECAIGVVTHSQFHADKVRQKFLGPVDVIYHPFYSYSSSIANNLPRKADLGIPEDKILIISVGHVNPNKRVDKVINVLGEHKDIAEGVIYVIIGCHDHREYYSKLQSLVERYNLHNVVKFLGHQPDNILHAYLLSADIAVNLRYPITEGASWSLIEQLHFAKPVIVNNTGFYNELPDDCVVKIDIAKEEDLYHVFKKLVYDDKVRENIGMKGKQFAAENFTPRKYCQKFIDFLNKVKYWVPISELVDKVSLELVDKVSTELALMGVSDDSIIVDEVAKEIYRLVRGQKSQIVSGPKLGSKDEPNPARPDCIHLGLCGSAAAHPSVCSGPGDTTAASFPPATCSEPTTGRHHKEPYNREGILHFPLYMGSHDTGFRYLFDFTVVAQSLNLRPGAEVLDFACGPCYVSEFLNRLGYITVAFDINPEIQAIGRERFTLDRRCDLARTRFVAGDGMRLPFRDESFDGIICMNALHHMPDYRATLAEMYRVLRPGGRAVFSEPGSEHSETPEAINVMKQYGVLEKDVVLSEIYQLSKEVGFQRMVLKPYVYPDHVELNYVEFDRFKEGRKVSTPLLTYQEIADIIERSHPLFYLEKDGARPLTSASAPPELLRARLVIKECPSRVRKGETMKVVALCENIGQSLWLSAPRSFGGYVTFGVKILAPDGRLLDDTHGRKTLSMDVLPGGRVEVVSEVSLEGFEAGRYRVLFDMVNELVCWFQNIGSEVVERWLEIV